MELSSFVRRMSALKNEFLYVLPKATDAKTCLSNMDQIFMILTLFKLGTEFDNIREQILIGVSRPLMTFLLGYCAIHPLRIGLGTLRFP